MDLDHGIEMDDFAPITKLDPSTFIHVEPVDETDDIWRRNAIGIAAEDVIEYRLIDGRPTVWNRSTVVDPCPFPRIRLFGRCRHRG